MQRQRNARGSQAAGKSRARSAAARRQKPVRTIGSLTAPQKPELPVRDKLKEARNRARGIRGEKREGPLAYRHVFTPTPPFDIGKFEYIDGVQSIHAQTRLSPQVFQLWRRLGEMEVIYGQPLDGIGQAPGLLVIHKRDAQNLARNGISVRLTALKKSRVDPEVFCRLIDLSDEETFKGVLNDLVQFKPGALAKPVRRRPVLQN